MSKSAFRALAACILAAFVVHSGSAFAGRLVMSNGDVITGAISKVEDGEVYIEPSYADEFAVSLGDVVSMEDDKVLEVEFADGTQVTGQFGGSNDAGDQILLVDGCLTLT
jgi:hypothetical protein